MTILNQGSMSQVQFTVQARDLASELIHDVPGLQFPAVYTTGKVISHLEIAAAKALLVLLNPGEISVGIDIQLTHLAPTAQNEIITAQAIYLGLDGKFHHFEVIALDAQGEIARGKHHRAIIPESKIIAAANKRKA